MDGITAAQTIRKYCPSGRVAWLFGPDNAAKRQQMMTELLGRKIPKSQAGVVALEKLCKESLGMTPYYPGCQVSGQYYGCSAVEEHFIAWLLEGISTPTNTQPAQQEIEA